MIDSEGRVPATEEEKLRVAHTLYAAYLAGTITGDDYQQRYSSLMTKVYVDEVLTFLHGLPSAAANGSLGNDIGPTAGSGNTAVQSIDLQGLSTTDSPAAGRHDGNGAPRANPPGPDPVELAMLMRQNTRTKTGGDYRWITLTIAIILVILLLLLGIMLMSRYHARTSGAPRSGISTVSPATLTVAL
ncbi:MAG: hypothetical protein ACYDGY_03880 [Acidimicrobiales bacterium]